MPKFNSGFDFTDVDAAEGFDDYDGPLPINGVYQGILKIAKIVPMKKDKTKNRIAVAVEIAHPDYKSKKGQNYLAWGGVNLTDQGKPFVAQFLKALTDGSDAEFDAIRRVFGSGTVVDEKKENILKIGKHKVNSPKGELPIRVQLKQETYEGKTNAKIQTFLSVGESGSSGGDGGGVVEESDVAEDEGEDEDVSADVEAEEDEDADVEGEDDGEAEEPADETIFDADAEEEEGASV